MSEPEPDDEEEEPDDELDDASLELEADVEESEPDEDFCSDFGLPLGTPEPDLLSVR